MTDEPRRADVDALVERTRAMPPGRPPADAPGIAIPDADPQSRAVWEAERADRVWGSAIPSRFRWATYRDFPPQIGEELEHWGTAGAGANLVLLGPVGTGKTHAAVAAARVCHDRHLDVAFYPVVELLDMLRPGGPDAAMEELTSVDVLVLDDVGAERPTDWTGERLYALINRRWLEERRTIATSNLEPDALQAAVGTRTYSRLIHGALALSLTGVDRRSARGG